MVSKRILTSAVAAVMTVAFAVTGFAADEAAKPAPVLTIPEQVHEVGTVPKGDKIDYSFLIRNSGKSDLQILSATPSCGCTVADFDKVIKPGATGKVTAHVDTTAFTGPITKSITIQTNDPKTPSSQLTLKATVKPYVEAFPAQFVRFTLTQGDKQTQTVKVFSAEPQAFEITGIENPKDYITVNTQKIEKKEDRVEFGANGQNQYAVNISIDSTKAKPGILSDRVIIKTNSKHQPELPININGIVRPTYSVMPTALNFGEVTAGDPAAVRTVVLQTNENQNPGDFRVTKAESSDPSAFTAEVIPGAAPGQFQLLIRVKDGAKTGNLDGSVKIQTTDSINPTFTLPVRGVVKAPAAK
ncbi:MAG: DUF1573 domain-containing protein [Thermoanaerobaculia bacterium]